VVSMLKSRGIVFKIKDLFQYQTIEMLAVYASECQEQEPSISRGQIAQLLISERDEFKENDIETVI